MEIENTHALKSAAKPWEHLIGFCMSGGNVGLSLILFNFISNFSFSFITFNYWSNSCQVPLARLNRNYSFIFNFYGEWKPYEDNRQRNSDKIKTQSQHGNSSATNNQALLLHILEEWTLCSKINCYKTHQKKEILEEELFGTQEVIRQRKAFYTTIWRRPSTP